MEYDIIDIERWVQQEQAAFSLDVVKSLLNEIYQLRATYMQLFVRNQELERYAPEKGPVFADE